jgi:hypothetical protein
MLCSLFFAAQGKNSFHILSLSLFFTHSLAVPFAETKNENYAASNRM